MNTFGFRYPGRSGSILLLILLLLAACTPSGRQTGSRQQADREAGEVRYARLFTIARENGCTRITVAAADSASRQDPFTYLLVPEGKPVPEDAGEAMVVRIPLKKVTCENGFQVSLLQMLGRSAALAGVSGKQRVGQDDVHRKIDSGELAVTGFMRGMNMERLLKTAPDMVFVNTTGVASDVPGKLRSCGLTPGMFSASLEEHPLGAFEWIRFMGAFFDRDSLADALFSERERAYLDVQARVADVKRRPSVIAGYSRKGAWSTMGSSRWFATMLDHAGANYLFKGKPFERGHLIGQEAGLSAGMSADFWVNTHFRAVSIDDLTGEDSRYGLFRSVRERRVYNNNGSCFANGRSRFWDTGMTEPHLILADLVSIFHPELMPGHKLKYYRRLDRKPLNQ